MARQSFNHQEIESQAQKQWEEEGIYAADLEDSSRDPYYLLVEFPYPSGDLHIGHWYAFAVTDIFARFMRMQGRNVLFPFGFDAFGLPAENAAIKRGLDPRKWTYENMESMRAQVRSMGTSLDWSKEVVTCSPEYYKWTQWLFSRMYEHGLAERKEAPVKWCPHDQTVLANEQVIDGKCERCGHAVEERSLTQWFLAITKYAERLLTDLDVLPWKEDIKDAQRAWIGKSEGANIAFDLHFDTHPEDNDWTDAEGNHARIAVFTTRPDTLFGVTYLVLAPEHPWVAAALDGERDALANESEVRKYVEATKARTERERMEGKDKTGVELKGIHAVHPITKEELPVFVADYVLGGYGTGAVMAVPAHDERDFDFATAHSLPVKQVVMPSVIDATNPPQQGKQDTKRTIILAVLHNPKDDTYLTLSWKKQAWTTFITGGVEADEDAVEAARREILEETGYSDVKFERSLGMYRSRFFAAHKDVNRDVRNTVLLFTLGSEAQEERSSEEKEQYDLSWKTAQEIEKAGMQHAEFPLFWKQVLHGNGAYDGMGLLINSGEYDGRGTREAMWDIVEAAGGERTTTYRLRDWLVSRQRYWGCPIPVVYDPEGNPHLIPTEHLPWLLPEDVDFKAPSGTSPLATSQELKDRVTGIFGEGWTPEYDTLDTFVDSSWYYLRYLTPADESRFGSFDLMQKWMPVDRYSGGSEHTTMHLLYARFFYKALYDMALVPTPEPFGERYNRGLILGPDGQKMSKSKGNVLNPDEYVEKYGADAVRAYLAFIGPYNEAGSYPWKPEGVEAMRRFLDRVYALSQKAADAKPSTEEQKALARAASKMANDIERFKLNTAVSSLMIALNALEASESLSRESFQTYIRLLAPFAPHLAESLFEGEGSIHSTPWPVFDPSLMEEDVVTIGVQVAGKRRGEIRISPTATEEEAVKAALSDPQLRKAFPDGSPAKVIYREGKILNLIP
jgi:leucyl-tRNA synthetase